MIALLLALFLASTPVLAQISVQIGPTAIPRGEATGERRAARGDFLSAEVRVFVEHSHRPVRPSLRLSRARRAEGQEVDDYGRLLDGSCVAVAAAVDRCCLLCSVHVAG